MKKFVLFLAMLFIFLQSDSKRYDKPSFEQQLLEIKKNSTIEDRADYWKSHAYVNLNLMKLKINQIILSSKNK